MRVNAKSWVLVVIILLSPTNVALAIDVKVPTSGNERSKVDPKPSPTGRSTQPVAKPGGPATNGSSDQAVLTTLPENNPFTADPTSPNYRPDLIIQNDDPAARAQREERLRLQINQTIQQLQINDNSDDDRDEVRHRDPLAGDQREEFDPKIQTVDNNRKLAREKELVLAKEMDRSLKKLEQSELTPAQQRQLEMALTSFEKSGKSEGDYYQVVAQLMDVANGYTVGKEIAMAPGEAGILSESPASTGSAVIVSAADKATEMMPETQKVATAGLKEISKILKPEEVAVVKPIFGKATKGTPVKQSGNYKTPLYGNFKADIPGATAPMSLQDKAKAWIKRIANLLTGKKPTPQRAPASSPDLVMSAEMEAAPTELLAPMEGAQITTAEIAPTKSSNYGPKVWGILLALGLLAYAFLRKSKLLH